MYRPAPAIAIKAAGNATDAVLAIEKAFAGRDDKKSNKRRADWKRIAAAYYHEGEPTDGLMVAKLKTGPLVSKFMIGAMQLDGGERNKYWSGPEEMAARAFQAYIEDKLAAADRRNDYLSVFADNKYHVDPLFGIEWKPYPEGEERQRINAAFDKLFEAIRNEKVYEKAVGNKALMDAIFGEQPDINSLRIDALCALNALTGSEDEIEQAAAVRRSLLDGATYEQAAILAESFKSARFWIANRDHKSIGQAAEDALALAKQAGEIDSRISVLDDAAEKDRLTAERKALQVKARGMFAAA
jgi:hypothetical protein